MNTLRLILFILVAVFHGFVIYFFAFSVQAAPLQTEESARVMKLTDLAEYIPPPPEPLPLPPPPPPPPRGEPLPDNAVEAIAEEMIETDEEPENQTVVEAGSIITPQPPVTAPRSTEEEYLPAHRISVLPVFPEDAIRAALRYPPIARRSNIEGRVVLDLFIDRIGIIQRIDVLREEPPNRGFGEAAREAFRGIRCEPAQANGERVSARVRYPVTFRLR
jgi:protein TonB